MNLTVIIPVYKAEHTLNRCVESVLCQNVPEMEVILVDDGSPDRCPQMCDEWAKKDSRVRVVHKKNGGLSDARNAGLDIARGDYITFVDSDDYLNDGVYAKLLSILGENKFVDIIEYSINCIGWKKADVQYTDCVYTNKMDYWRRTRAWNHSYVCNKIFKRDIFCGLRFSADKHYEDLWLQPEIINRSNVVATSSVVGYNYCFHASGITNTMTSEHLKHFLAAEENVAMEMNAHWYRERNLFMGMLYRQLDIYRLSGEIVLKWPFVRLVCWIHKHTKGRYHRLQSTNVTS